jgi:hypothetical protein
MSFRIPVNHNRKSSSSRLPPIVFAHNPNLRRKLKFLDFSPNKTRVIIDNGGGLPLTEVSVSGSSMTASSDFRNGDEGRHYVLASHSTLQSAGEASRAPDKATEV